MITFVYCCICLLIVCCQTTRIENEDNDNTYANDSPQSLPKMIPVRYKPGTDILLGCNVNHHHKNNITWEFKRCPTNYKEIQCDIKNIYKLDINGTEWKTLDFNRSKRKLKVRNASEENAGMYRCIYKNSIIKIYTVDVKVAKYEGPSPKVISLVVSANSTILPNTTMTIQCKVWSEIPPAIRWFKQCNGQKCPSGVKDNGHSYSALPNSAYLHATGNNTYLSKFKIHHARNVDSGIYICLAISSYGKDFKNVTIKVADPHSDGDTNKSFSLLFLIPLCFVLVPVSIWMCFYRRKKRNHQNLNEHRKGLIKPVVKVDIVLEVDEVV